MQGDYPSDTLCPAIATYLLALVLGSVAYALVEAWARAHGAEERGVAATLRHLRPSTLLWELPFLAALAFLYVWCANGLYDGTDAVVTGACLAVTVAGACVLPRNALAGLFAWVAAKGEGTRWVWWLPQVGHAILHVGVLAACTHLARVAVEMPWNAEWESIEPQYVAIEAAIIALVLLVLYFVGNQHGVGVAAGIVAMLVIGIANYFVFLFKNAAITPADLMALGTAAEVAGAYVYVIDEAVVEAVGYALAGVACAAYLLPYAVAEPTEAPASDAAPEAAPCDGGAADAEDADVPATPSGREAPRRRRRVRLATMGGGAVASAVALACLVTIPRYGADFGVSLDHWNPMRTESAQGFWPCFVKEVQAMQVPVPEGYSEQAVADAQARLDDAYDDTEDAEGRASAEAQFSQLTPSVVVIMNESYSDLSSIADIEAAGYEGPAWYHGGLTDALAMGDCYTTIYGGGTCNTEFEALTDVNLHFVGEYVYPYTQNDLARVECLPRSFKALGYSTTAIHPNQATNWNRATAYAQMGFDRFLDIDDFDLAVEDYYHSYPSDAATYEKVLDILRDDDSPQFVHVVTMQNHSPYTMGSIPASDQLSYAPADCDGGDGNAQLNEYLACINESDRAIEDFIAQLRQLDRPVVVLFFGDHQPSLSSAYSDASYPDDSDVEHAERIFHTCYFVWANYDVAGRAQDSPRSDQSAAALGALTCDLVGAPLTDLQKATLGSREDILALNLDGYEDADGTWHPYDDDGNATGDEAETEHDLALVTYATYGEAVK